VKKVSLFGRLNLLTKLLINFSVVAVCIVIVGFAAYLSGKKTVVEYEKIALKNLPTSVITTNLRGTAKDFRSMVFRLGFADNSDDELAAIQEKINELIDLYQENNREYSALSFVDGEKQLFDAANSKWNDWVLVAQKCVEERMKKTPEGMAAYLGLVRGEFRESANLYFEEINTLAMFHQQGARLAREKAEEMARIGHMASIALICLGTLIALGIGFYFGKNLTKSLMAIIQKISFSSAEVGQASQQLSISSQQIATGSAEGASSLQETVASIEVLAEMVKTNASHAKQAAQLSLQSRSSAEAGEIEITKLVTAISEVAQSSQKISDIINVIDDIAFQTNLLALNAAVEAARAGEQGKGFAVVAEAVRSLAQRSAVAAKDIESLIKDSVDKIERGKKIADHSGGVLKNIVDSVNKVAQLNEEVASASQGQSDGLNQINKSVRQLDEGTQRNAASAEEAASTSEQMAMQAVKLREMVHTLTEIVKGQADQVLKEEMVSERKVVSMKSRSQDFNNDSDFYDQPGKF